MKAIDNSSEFKVIQNKSLKPPVDASYVLKNDEDFFAEGVITVTVDENNAATDIVPFWADDNGKLEGYSSLHPFKILGEVTRFSIDSSIIIPNKAKKLLLYAMNYDTFEITDDCYEIILPKREFLNEEDEIIAEFQVVSDVHVRESEGNSFYGKMLNSIVSLSPESLGIFISGDLTAGGRITEYEKQIELHNSVENAPNYYMSIGNHEFYDCGYDNQTETIARFINYAKLPNGKSPENQHYDFYKNGYHFIFLGNDFITRDLLSATYNEQTLLWLREKLDENRNLNKPSFLFCHYPLQNTVAGSRGEFIKGAFTGIWGENAARLNKLLADFTEVIMFTGHQHFALGYPNTMFCANKNFPIIFNTSSASQVATCRDGIKKKGVGSEGYFVYIYKDKLLVRGYNFEKDEWIASAQFFIEI